MPALDHNAPFLLSAFAITVVVLAVYGLYLWSRLKGVRARAVAISVADHSARNVSAAAPMATTAQPASSANGPRRL
jgi:hypothetical protein